MRAKGEKKKKKMKQYHHHHKIITITINSRKFRAKFSVPNYSLGKNSNYLRFCLQIQLRFCSLDDKFNLMNELNSISRSNLVELTSNSNSNRAIDVDEHSFVPNLDSNKEARIDSINWMSAKLDGR